MSLRYNSCSCKNPGYNISDSTTISSIKGEIQELIDVAWTHEKSTEHDQILARYLKEVQEQCSPMETSLNILDFVEDLNECGSKSLCFCEQLKLVELVNYQIDNKPFEEAAVVVKCILKFLSNSELSNRIQLDKIWNFVFQSDMITSECKNLLTKLDPKHLENLIKKVLEENTVHISYNESYVNLLNILTTSESFQFFSKVMVKIIMKDDTDHINQKFLSSFLKNLKEKVGQSAFYKLYDQSIQSFVIILENIDGAKSEFLEDKLKELKSNDRTNFNVLVTHYPEMLYTVDLE